VKNLKIGNRVIGDGHKPYFIADIAANHDGDINRAYKLITLAKEAGADAAKFQNFKAKTIVSKSGFGSMGTRLSHQKDWEKSVYEIYQEASVPDEWSELLKIKCDSVGIEYMTSPYDFESVDWADSFVNCFKIGSGDITWIDIIEHIARKGKPVLLATGASDMEDVRRAMSAIMQHTGKIILMQCNTNYTANTSNFAYINLNVIKTYQKAFPEAIIGISDHTHGHETVLGAIALGACVIEKHFTDDNERAGPDHKFSMTPKTWRQMVTAANNLHDALGNGVKHVEENEMDTAVVQRRALYYVRNINAGEAIKKSDLFPVRPMNEGDIAPYEIGNLVGKTLKKDVLSDTAVKRNDLLL